MKVIFHKKTNVYGCDGKKEVPLVILHLLHSLPISLDVPQDQLQRQNAASSEVCLRILPLESEFQELFSRDFDGFSEVLKVKCFEEIPVFIIIFKQNVRFLFQVIESMQLLTVQMIIITHQKFSPMTSRCVCDRFCLQQRCFNSHQYYSFDDLFQQNQINFGQFYYTIPIIFILISYNNFRNINKIHLLFVKVLLVNIRAMDKVQKQNATVELLPYKKIVFHCLRYSSHKVYGALIAQKTNPNTIINAFPLFHTPIVNPSFSVALDLIESNLQPNQEIVGFYEFIENGDSSINRIIETNPSLKGMRNLRLWMVDSSEIKFGMTGFNLALPKFDEVRKDILKGEHNFIVDFDAHFEQIELDFTNSYIK